ncbi:MAG: hypothetical protein HY815_11300 [Candidatus Riflebacteria bacterium]|nr:hypothetical protein [Candidatus Riflebacteria bacterium]
MALVILLAWAGPALAQTTATFATSLDSALIPLGGPVIEPGDTIYIHVANGPVSLFPFDNAITADIVTSRGDTERIYLFETDQDSTYTGFIKTKFGPKNGPPVIWNGQLEVRGNDTVTVTVQNAPQITATVLTNGTVKLLEIRENADSLNIPVNPLPEEAGELKLLTVGKSFLIRVVDDDRNLNPGVVDTIALVPLQVQIVGGVDLEIPGTGGGLPLLSETGPDSGVFELVVPTRYARTVTPNNGILEIDAGVDRIIATYNDLFTTHGIQPLPALADVRGGYDGTIQYTSPIAPPILTPGPGMDLRVQVDDRDDAANQHAGPGNDTVMVTLTAYNVGHTVALDRETFEVNEDNLEALPQILFLRSIPFRFIPTGSYTVHNGVLEVAPGQEIWVTYNDALRATGERDVPISTTVNVSISTAWANVEPTMKWSNDLFCGDRPNPPGDVIKPGDTVYMCVTDVNSDLSSDVDRVTVTLVTQPDLSPAPGPNDREVVVLTETGPHTGIFAGWIDSRFGDPIVQRNGMLDVRGRDTPTAQVTATYLPFWRQGGPIYPIQGLRVHIDGAVRIVANGTARGSNAAGPIRVADNGGGEVGTIDQFTAGEGLFLQLVDDDANVNPNAADSIEVTLSSFSGADPPTGPIQSSAANLVDQLRVRLYETGPSTGIFVVQPNLLTDIQHDPFNFIPTRYTAGAGDLTNSILEVRAEGPVDPPGPWELANHLNTVVIEYPDTERTYPTQPAWPRDSVFIRKGHPDTAPNVVDAVTGGDVQGGDDLRVTVQNEPDASFHTGPGNDTLTVTVTSYAPDFATVVDVEQVVLHEDNGTTGDFEGLFPTAYVNGRALDPTRSQGNGILEVRTGGRIVAVYTDPLRYDGRPNFPVASATTPANGRAVVTPAAAAVRFVSSNDATTTNTTLNPTAKVTLTQPGDTLWIRVDDQAAQAVPNNHTNGVTVTLRVLNGAIVEDQETLFVAETPVRVFEQAPNEIRGVYMGQIDTIWGDTIGTGDFRRGDGTLQVRGRNIVEVSYWDITNSAVRADVTYVHVLGEAQFMSNGGTHEQQGNNAFRLDGRLQAIKVLNETKSDQLTVRAGDPIRLVVIDDDRNADPVTAETFTVVVSYPPPPAVPVDQETVTLRETGPDTGVFVLDPTLYPDGLRTQLNAVATAGDNIVQVPAGGRIHLRYPDTTVPSPAYGPSITVDIEDDINVQPAGEATLLVNDQATPDLVTNTVMAGHNLFIRVTEPAIADPHQEPRFDPNVLDTVTVNVTSGSVIVGPGGRTERDVEAVALHETGLDTRVFEGFLPTVHNRYATPTNGVLEIADTDAARRPIAVTYVDPQPVRAGTLIVNDGTYTAATSNVLVITYNLLTRLGADATIGIVSTWCTNDDEFILGDTLRVTVSDPGFAGIDVPTVGVTITAPSGDQEYVILGQTAVGSGFFDTDAAPSHRVPTAFDQSIVRFDGLVEMVGGCTSDNAQLRGEPLIATYVIPLDASGHVMRPVSATIRGFTRATLRAAIDRQRQSPPTPARPNPLPEPQPVFPGEQALFTKDDTLTVFKAYDRIWIKVVDPDMNCPPRSTNSLTVTLTTNNLVNGITPGDFEVIRLTEQPRLNGETVRGVFIGSIGTVPAPANTTPVGLSGTVELVGRDLVTLTYQDFNTNVANTCLISSINTSTETRNDGQIQIVDGPNSSTSVSIISLTPLPGQATAMVWIRIVDKDLDGDNLPGTDQGPVVTITTDAGDSETVNTFESATVPGEFRGQIPIVYGRPPVSGSTRIEVTAGDKVTACYTDDFNINPGIPTQRCASAFVERFYGAVLEVFVPRTGLYHPPNRLEEFIIPERLRVRVRDQDQNLTAARDAVQVTFATNNPIRPDQETLILTESGNDTGMFEGEIPTAFPDNLNSPANLAARQNNGVLTCVGGDTLTITYVDAHAPP